MRLAHPDMSRLSGESAQRMQEDTEGGPGGERGQCSKEAGIPFLVRPELAERTSELLSHNEEAG